MYILYRRSNLISIFNHIIFFDLFLIYINVEIKSVSLVLFGDEVDVRLVFEVIEEMDDVGVDADFE